MADNVSLRISSNGISRTIDGMLSRSSLVQGWLNRNAYPMLVNVQRDRWMSENASQGGKWEALNPSYAIAKLKRFANFPGGGRKMLVATGRLVDAVTGDNKSDHYKLVSANRLEMGTTVPYAKYVNEERNFTNLSADTIKALSENLKEYIVGKR